MKACACLLVVALTLTACDGKDLVGVGAAHQERPSRCPDEATMMPMCISLYRVGGTHDPASPDYNPSVADTALMHVPHTFAWIGLDPDGLCDPLLFRHRMDGDAFSEWSTDTSRVIDGPADGDTVGSDFTILWEGDDPDGEVALFQYVLDPAYNVYRKTEASEAHYVNAPGAHEFRLRARDGSGCWSESWAIIRFYAE